MMTDGGRLNGSILRLAEIVQRKLDERFQSPDSLKLTAALDQAGLRNGLQIVDDFLRHNEFGCAFEHVVYMLVEPEIELTQAQFEEVVAIGTVLGLNPNLWNRVSVLKTT